MDGMGSSGGGIVRGWLVWMLLILSIIIVDREGGGIVKLLEL